jgi:hypothetical protein
MARLGSLTENLLPELSERVRQDAPDYLLVDTKSLWGRLISQVLDVPAVTLLVGGYEGPRYQVRRSDDETLDVGLADGYADAASHDAFCTGGSCTVAIIYDQAPHGNHLTPAPSGSAKPTPGKPAGADRLPVTINGRSVYGLLFRPGEGYRAACNDCPYPVGPSGMAVGDEPETIYMVSSQHDLVNGCCFDYGNAETTQNNDGNGTAEAVYLGQGVIWGSGVDGGPWVMADLENGLYPGIGSADSKVVSTGVVAVTTTIGARPPELATVSV